jgi:ABC-2 type transport system ATP-binding protein
VRPVLSAENLKKSYGRMPALQGLSFTLNAGRVLGFLGPNGAGKTTAIRILTTILRPSSGTFSVDGIGWEDPVGIRRKIGVLPESLGFPKQVTAIEYLTFFGRMFGRDAGEARAVAKALLDDVGLAKRARSVIGTYSRGMRQRLGIARALVNDPVVVFLDEPTLGLDPRGQQELLELVRRIARDRNAGVVLCSHHLSDIESVCDDVVILNAGELVACGTVHDIIGRAHRNVLRIQVPVPSIDEAVKALKSSSSVLDAAPNGASAGWLVVRLADSADVNSPDGAAVKNGLLDVLIRAGIPILGFEVGEGRLQEVFFQLTHQGSE